MFIKFPWWLENSRRCKVCAALSLVLCWFVYVGFYSKITINLNDQFPELATKKEIQRTFPELPTSNNKYENSTLKCPTFTQETCSKVEIPKQMCINGPVSPYPTCGNLGMFYPVAFSQIRQHGAWMIFFVKSAPDHFKKRKMIRRTWASVSSIKTKKFVTIFLLGRVKNKAMEKRLKEENGRYGDILQCDFVDSYFNLIKKVLAAFRWVLDENIYAAQYAFCDDDSVMHIQNIFEYFTWIDEQKHRRSSITCGFYKATPEDLVPHRDTSDKWYVSRQMYDADKYPVYCLGALWILPRDILHDIYCAAERTDPGIFTIEDAFVTGVLRYKVSPVNQIPTELPQMMGWRKELMFYPPGFGGEEKWDQLPKMKGKWTEYNKNLQNKFSINKELTYYSNMRNFTNEEQLHGVID